MARRNLVDRILGRAPQSAQDDNSKRPSQALAEANKRNGGERPGFASTFSAEAFAIVIAAPSKALLQNRVEAFRQQSHTWGLRTRGEEADALIRMTYTSKVNGRRRRVVFMGRGANRVEVVISKRDIDAWKAARTEARAAGVM